jgi:hypothetical protein
MRGKGSSNNMMTLEEQKLAMCEKLPELFNINHIINRINIGEDWNLISWHGSNEINWPTEGLQVCHEAEKLLTENDMEAYADALSMTDSMSGTYPAAQYVHHWKYEQRLEALCRVWWPKRFV